MNKMLIYLLLFIGPLFLTAQNEFHVFPKDHSKTPGKAEGQGSTSDPWDLQTALSQPNSVVKSGDTIWIHGGVYNGRFISTLKGNQSRKKIVVSAVDGEKVVLNGNVESKRKSVLDIHGPNVMYRNLEITFIGEYPRRPGQPGFQKVNGVFHTRGEDCHFYGLRIHNNPGVGFGSWKATGGTIIEFCKVYNNGHMGKKGGVGEGFYVQNQSDKERIIRNNFIFNNYYKGIEVWSASSGGGFEFVKNVRLENNVIFNNGLPANRHVDNLIIASNDSQGVNVAKNIKVINNILYHNVDHNDKANYGEGSSLTLGWNPYSPVEDVRIVGNFIIGKSNGIRFFHVKSMKFIGNTVYSGYLDYYKSTLKYLEGGSWNVLKNTYYTRKAHAFRIIKFKYYTLNDWKITYAKEVGSTWNPIREFYMNKPLYVYRSPQNAISFDIAVLNSEAQSVMVDFTNLITNENIRYKVRDLASGEVLYSGEITNSKTIEIKAGNHNGTALNFGVYTVEFLEEEKSKRNSFLERLFGWIF